MPSKNYWINRANQRMDDYILRSEETANEIAKAYYVASKRIEKEMVRVVQGLGAISDDRTALKYLKNPQSKSVIRTIRKAVSTMPDGPEKDEALTLISSPAYLYRMRRLQAVIDNARKECNRLYKVELKDATAHLRNLYNDAFSHTIYDIDKGYNTLHTFSMFPASRVNTLLKSEWSGANYSERIWNSTQNLADSLKEQLLISFMTGASVSKTAREISERFQVSAYNARRLVRTESNYIANQAEHDAYKRLGIEEYQFIATLDTRTSKLCRELDGRVFNVEDGKPGVNMPPMHPNCRSTTIMYDADSPIKSRAARDENGKLISFPGNMTYKQWLREYHPELVDKAGGSGIIKAIALDDFELRTYGAGLTKEFEEALWKEIVLLQKTSGVYFDDVIFKEASYMMDKKSAIETEMVETGKIVININKDMFAGLSLKQVDELFNDSSDILANSLHEAIVHERGHVKTMKGKSSSQVTEMFKELKSKHITGVSEYASTDGAECIAEVEILLERGEDIPKDAMALYNEYTKGDSK